MIRDATDTSDTEPSGKLDGTEDAVVRPDEPVHPQSAPSGAPMRVLENVWKRQGLVVALLGRRSNVCSSWEHRTFTRAGAFLV